MANKQKIWIIDDNTNRDGAVIWAFYNGGEYFQDQIEDVDQFIHDRRADGERVIDNRGCGFSNSWN